VLARAPVGESNAAKEVAGKMNTEAALMEAQLHYRCLFDNMLEGYAYCQLIYEPDRAIDFVHLEVNKRFETLTGLKDVVGKTVSEAVPGIHQSNPGINRVRDGKEVNVDQDHPIDSPRLLSDVIT
jgi:PAS domain-containing protein